MVACNSSILAWFLFYLFIKSEKFTILHYNQVWDIFHCSVTNFGFKFNVVVSKTCTNLMFVFCVSNPRLVTSDKWRWQSYMTHQYGTKSPSSWNRSVCIRVTYHKVKDQHWLLLLVNYVGLYRYTAGLIQYKFERNIPCRRI